LLEIPLKAVWQVELLCGTCCCLMKYSHKRHLAGFCDRNFLILLVYPYETAQFYCAYCFIFSSAFVWDCQSRSLQNGLQVVFREGLGVVLEVDLEEGFGVVFSIDHGKDFAVTLGVVLKLDFVVCLGIVFGVVTWAGLSFVFGTILGPTFGVGLRVVNMIDLGVGLVVGFGVVRGVVFRIV